MDLKDLFQNKLNVILAIFSKKFIYPSVIHHFALPIKFNSIISIS